MDQNSIINTTSQKYITYVNQICLNILYLNFCLGGRDMLGYISPQVRHLSMNDFLHSLNFHHN